MQLFVVGLAAIIVAVVLACITMICLMLWEPGQGD